MSTPQQRQLVLPSRRPPIQIPGLQLWLDASQIPDATDGAAVATWPDASGNSYDFVQTTEAYRPVFRAGMYNGAPCLRFDGSNDYLTHDTLQLALKVHTAFLVHFQVTTSASSLGLMALKPTSGSTGNDYDGVGARSWESSNNRGSQVVARFAAGQASQTYQLTYAGGATTAYIATEVKSAGSGTLYINGASKATDTAFTELSDNSGGGVYLGARYYSNSLGLYNNVDIMEIIWSSQALSDTDRKAVEQYLSAKYGIALS